MTGAILPCSVHVRWIESWSPLELKLNLDWPSRQSEFCLAEFYHLRPVSLGFQASQILQGHRDSHHQCPALAKPSSRTAKICQLSARIAPPCPVLLRVLGLHGNSSGVIQIQKIKTLKDSKICNFKRPRHWKPLLHPSELARSSQDLGNLTSPRATCRSMLRNGTNPCLSQRETTLLHCTIQKSALQFSAKIKIADLRRSEVSNTPARLSLSSSRPPSGFLGFWFWSCTWIMRRSSRHVSLLAPNFRDMGHRAVESWTISSEQQWKISSAAVKNGHERSPRRRPWAKAAPLDTQLQLCATPRRCQRTSGVYLQK